MMHVMTMGKDSVAQKHAEGKGASMEKTEYYMNMFGSNKIMVVLRRNYTP